MHAMESVNTAPLIFLRALDGCKWSDSSSGCFTSEQKVADTRGIGSCVGPTNRLDFLEISF